eukprot:11839532-Alexandrium_andersonii.AAC.1
MSASLVGSEMCIRDSLPTEAALWGARPKGPHICCLQGGEAPVEPALRGDPVSYTHLTLPTICSV